MGAQIYLSQKEARYLFAVCSNFWESVVEDLGEDGANRLIDKLRRIALSAQYIGQSPK